jgi:hypothetical protein
MVDVMKRKRYSVVVDGKRYEAMALSADEAILTACTDNGIKDYAKATAKPVARKTGSTMGKLEAQVARKAKQYAVAVMESRPEYIDLSGKLETAKAIYKALKAIDKETLQGVDLAKFELRMAQARLLKLKLERELQRLTEVIINPPKVTKATEKEPLIDRQAIEASYNRYADIKY